MAPLSDSPSTEQLLESLPMDESLRTNSKRHGCLSSSSSPENPLAVGYPFSPYRRRKLNGSSSSFSSHSTLKLKVSFNETVQIRKFTPNWALPCEQEQEGEEQHSHLYESHQNRQLDFQCIETLKKQSTDTTTTCATNLEEEHGWCARGLECHFEETSIAQRRKCKLQTALVVLLYQARGETAEEIARHYSTISRASQTRAWRQGLLDELDAKHDLGISVLQSLKAQRNSNAQQQSSQLNRAMQELKYYQHLAGGTTGDSSRRRSQRLANIFTV